MVRALLGVAVAVGLVGCARSQCGEEPCRRPGGSECGGERIVRHTTSLGWCDEARAECTFAAPREFACPAMMRCEEGVCVYVPSECPGCSRGNVCHRGDGDDACGVAGAQCVACGASSVCVAGQCEPCPPMLVARNGQCLVDDTSFDVELPPWAVAAEFGDTLVIWDWSAIPVTVGRFTARADGGTLNGTSLGMLELPLRSDPVWHRSVLHVTAPSGRTRSVQIESIHSRAISPGRRSFYPDPDECRLTSQRTLSCATGSPPAFAEPLVDLTDERVLTSSGRVFDFSGGTASPRFSDAGVVVRVSWPCALTLQGSVLCQEDGAPAWKLGGGPWRQVECRDDACCALGQGGGVWCWGSHDYGLFVPPDSSGGGGQEEPGPIPRLAGSYRQLASAPKDYFAREVTGRWWSATGRSLLLNGPSWSSPAVLDALGTDVVHLDSPYYDVVALHSDGSLAVHHLATGGTARTLVQGVTLLDVAAQYREDEPAVGLTPDLRHVLLRRLSVGTYDVVPID